MKIRFFIDSLNRSLLSGHRRLASVVAVLIGGAAIAGSPWLWADDQTSAEVATNDVIASDEGKNLMGNQKSSADKAEKKPEEIDYKKISNREWKKRLTAEQYRVTRAHGTERAFSGEYHNSKKDGIYTCICCGLPLFDSANKFDSGTGWPSYYQPLSPEVIGTSTDNKLLYTRIEVHCARCEAHLGHVFKDAPQTPTGLRYCMNSVALKLEQRDDVELPSANAQDDSSSVVPSTVPESASGASQ